MCLICLKRGGPRKRLRRKIYSRSVGRGPSSSQSPYPSLPAYAESSLIPMLVLSPRKPLRWVFAGAPVLLKFSAVRPRRTAIVRRRVQDPFGLGFPSAAALPTSQRFILIFYPGSAKRSGERGKRRAVHSTTTPKAVPTPPNAGKHPLCSPRLKRTPVPASRFPPHRHPRPPVPVQTRPAGRDLDTKAFFFWTGRGPFSLARPKKMGGAFPSKGGIPWNSTSSASPK